MINGHDEDERINRAAMAVALAISSAEHRAMHEAYDLALKVGRTHADAVRIASVASTAYGNTLADQIMR